MTSASLIPTTNTACVHGEDPRARALTELSAARAQPNMPGSASDIRCDLAALALHPGYPFIFSIADLGTRVYWPHLPRSPSTWRSLEAFIASVRRYHEGAAFFDVSADGQVTALETPNQGGTP